MHICNLYWHIIYDYYNFSLHYPYCQINLLWKNFNHILRSLTKGTVLQSYTYEAYYNHMAIV